MNQLVHVKRDTPTTPQHLWPSNWAAKAEVRKGKSPAHGGNEGHLEIEINRVSKINWYQSINWLMNLKQIGRDCLSERATLFSLTSCDTVGLPATATAAVGMMGEETNLGNELYMIYTDNFYCIYPESYFSRKSVWTVWSGTGFVWNWTVPMYFESVLLKNSFYCFVIVSYPKPTSMGTTPNHQSVTSLPVWSNYHSTFCTCARPSTTEYV